MLTGNAGEALFRESEEKKGSFRNTNASKIKWRFRNKAITYGWKSRVDRMLSALTIYSTTLNDLQLSCLHCLVFPIGSSYSPGFMRVLSFFLQGFDSVRLLHVTCLFAGVFTRALVTYRRNIIE